MAVKTGAQIAEKYGRGVSAAGPDYASGVANPSRPWAQATQQAHDRWKQGINEAAANGAFLKGVQKAGDQKWQQRAVNVGAQRYTAAAGEAAQSYAAVAERVMQAAGAARSAIANMPTATQDQRIQRAVASMKAISSHWKGGR